MLIGICGSICSGKGTVAQYLVEHHGFKYLRIDPAPTTGYNNTVVNGNSNAAPQGQGQGGKQQQPQQQQPVVSFRPGTTSRTLSFLDATALLDFVTKRWRERWVTRVESEPVLDLLGRRPFFLLISVDAPVTVRWRRHRQRAKQRRLLHGGVTAGEDAGRAADGDQDEYDDDTDDNNKSNSSLVTFVARSDAHLYDHAAGCHTSLMSRAALRLLNTSSDVAHLFATLGKVDLPNEDRLRPSWDSYFMSLASLAAQRSNCMKRRVGCVLVREKRVVSTGYNGTPRGLRNCGEGGCGRCNEGMGSGVGLATCLCLHAEENALLEAGRDRIRDGSILYCDTCPCLTCSIKIAQVGINEVVYSQGYSMDGDTAAVLREAGVRLRQFVPPANGLIRLENTELY